MQRRFALQPPSTCRPAGRMLCRLVPLILVPLAIASPGIAAAGEDPVPVSRAELGALDASIRPRVEEALTRAAQSGTADAIGELGILLHAYERFDLAARCYGEARRRASSVAAWAYFHGIALGQEGDVEGAVDALEAALRLDPSLTAARVRLGDLLFDLGRLDESEATYREVLRERPTSALAAYGLGRVLRARGEADGVAYLERAVEWEPSFRAALYALGQAYEAAGDRERAAAAFTRYRDARSQPSIDGDPMERVAAARSGPLEDLTRGRDLLRQGRHREAIDLLERAAAGKPDLVQAYVNLVAAYAASGDAERAEQAFAKASALSPQLPELHYNLGVLRLSQGRAAEAIAAFRTVLAGNPSHADAHNNLAYLLAKEGQTAEAIAHLRQALAIAPAHRDAHFNLARLLQAARAGEEALTHFAAAAELEDERTPLYLYYLADAHARLGHPREAERHALAARARAQALGQTDLVARIDEDLRRLREAMEVRR
ncbi:MAG TPA: tetratricopeptide repeat protein [Vicinamibacterales bacterium]